MKLRFLKTAALSLGVFSGLVSPLFTSSSLWTVRRYTLQWPPLLVEL